MSQEENVAAVRRFTDATGRGDLEAAAAELGSELEIDDTDIPESTGTDSFRVWLGRWNESWESWRAEEQEVIPVGEDKVLALFRMFVRGKGSGAELTRDDALLAEFRHGKIVKLGYYNDQSQARTAAGLSADR
jgi:ketosteroid isomerase-like protein